MRVVAVLSLKGGVGKTTVVLGLAGAALRRGVRTLVVDLDPQGNATTSLEPAGNTAALADALDDPRSTALRQAIAPSAWGEDLHVLVGSEDTERHNDPDPDRGGLSELARLLDRLPRDAAEAADNDPGDSARADGLLPYGLVLLDCPPSLGQLTRSALVAAQRAVLVTEPTIFAVSGAQRAFEAVQTERAQHNPDLQPLGVLVNKVRARSSEHAFRITELRELFGPLVLPGALPDRSAVQQAQGAGLPIQRWDTPGAREVAAIFDALLGRVLHSGRGWPSELAAAVDATGTAQPALRTTRSASSRN